MCCSRENVTTRGRAAHTSLLYRQLPLRPAIGMADRSLRSGASSYKPGSNGRPAGWFCFAAVWVCESRLESDNSFTSSYLVCRFGQQTRRRPSVVLGGGGRGREVNPRRCRRRSSNSPPRCQRGAYIIHRRQSPHPGRSKEALISFLEPTLYVPMTGGTPKTTTATLSVRLSGQTHTGEARILGLSPTLHLALPRPGPRVPENNTRRYPIQCCLSWLTLPRHAPASMAMPISHRWFVIPWLTLPGRTQGWLWRSREFLTGAPSPAIKYFRDGPEDELGKPVQASGHWREANTARLIPFLFRQGGFA